MSRGEKPTSRKMQGRGLSTLETGAVMGARWKNMQNEKKGNLLWNQEKWKTLIITPKESMLRSRHPSTEFLRADAR